MPPSTPRQPALVYEDEWEEYHPPQDDENVVQPATAEQDVDDDSSVAVSSTSARRRRQTPIKSPIRVRNRQSTRSKTEIPSTPRNGPSTPVRQRKAARSDTAPPVSSQRLSQASSRPSTPGGDLARFPPTSSAVTGYIAAALSTAVSLLYRLVLAAASLTSALLAPYLMPIMLAGSGVVLAGTALYFLLPRVPAFLVSLVASLLRRLLPTASLGLGALSDLGVLQSAAIGPARTAATPLCALLGVACEYSLLSSFRPASHLPNVVADPFSDTDLDAAEEEAEQLARPFWQWHWNAHLPSFPLGSGRRGSEVDVAGVARGLSREVKQARDIFESVQSMGSAGLVRNLHYVKIWELGTAVSVGSSLPERSIVGEELKDLGDMTRDLADEIMGIDHAAVNAFTWIQWEFSALLELLDSPNPPSNASVATRLHSLINQLDAAFTELHSLTSIATSTASLASDKGSRLYQSLTKIRYSLISERDRDPIWRQAWEKNKHRLVGGEVPRSEMLERDLILTGDTILSLHGAKEHLERVRILTKGYRDQIGLSQARMVGFHLGAEGAGIDAAEELRILGQLVGGLGDAVGEAKRKSKDSGPRRKGYREIGE